jgi:hypothetical protein
MEASPGPPGEAPFRLPVAGGGDGSRPAFNAGMDDSAVSVTPVPGGMWRVVCAGPGVNDSPRRVVDHGPLHMDRARAQAIADWLASTGLYESIKVVSSSLGGAADIRDPLASMTDGGDLA